LDGNTLTLRTADPALSFAIQLLPGPQPDGPIGEPIVLPEATCTVKANVSRDGRKLYHVEGMRNFNQVVIDPEHDERCFETVEEAEAAGWVRAGN
jgi:hypothetical protein